jgi:hypothetical protein
VQTLKGRQLANVSYKCLRFWSRTCEIADGGSIEQRELNRPCCLRWCGLVQRNARNHTEITPMPANPHGYWAARGFNSRQPTTINNATQWNPHCVAFFFARLNCLLLP